LDALRGLAAMAVMLFHFFAKGVSPMHDQLATSVPAWIVQILQKMDCGVEIFFVLSGFVIAFSMDRKVANLRYAGNFIVRRSLRLDPPYWVAMILMLSYFLIIWPTRWYDFYLMYSGIQGLAANFFYVQNLSWVYPAKSILDVSWTLCLEVQFYLTYLLILVAGHYVGSLTTRRIVFLGRTVIVLSIGVVAVWSFMSWIQHPTSDFAGRAWTFFLGVAVYRALIRGVPTIAVVIPLAAMAALFVWNQEIRSIVTVATAGTIYFAGVTGRLSTLFSYRPLLYLGKISYSIYLLHMVIGLNLLSVLAKVNDGSTMASWLSYAVAIILSLFGAHLLHRFVEAPSNRLSQRLKQRRPVEVSVHDEVACITSA